MPKPIRMKLKSGGFKSKNESDVVVTFKLSDKRYKSAPVGFFVFNPESSAVHMGFDANSDGVIAAKNKESVARYLLQTDPFDPFQTSEKIARRFSKKSMKTKLKFGSENVYGKLLPKASLFGESLEAPLKMQRGKAFESYDFEEFSDVLMAGGFDNDSLGAEESEDAKILFSKKSAAKRAAKDFGCKGAHKMGDKWMICKDHDDVNVLQGDDADAGDSYQSPYEWLDSLYRLTDVQSDSIAAA